MKIEFNKYEGAGNDFIMIDNRNFGFIPDSKVINRLCDRHVGIGADGLILLENDPELDFSMRYFNADGNEGSMCGNGGRCITWFVKNSGINKSEFTFNAIDGLHKATILQEAVDESIIKLKMIDVDEVKRMGNPDSFQGHFVDTGSPHFLVDVKNVDDIDVFNEGRKIRNSSAFKNDGVNVNFIQRKQNDIKIRTYERGVENETLACGTGSVAAALVSMFVDDKLETPINIKAKGGDLKVYAQRTGSGYSDIWLEGSAKSVFKGEINL